jgi:NAD+ kinase
MKIKSVLLVGDLRKEGVSTGVKRLSSLLKPHVTVRRRMGDEAPLVDIDEDLVVVLGGDGSVLSAVRRLGDLVVPVMGINFGNTGFLTARKGSELELVVNDIVSGDFQISERTRFEIEVRGELQTYCSTPLRALNDVVVERSTGRTCWITLVDPTGEETTFRGDGVIVSTSTGSSAYSHAAGGPILDPETNATIVTPSNCIDVSSDSITGSAKKPIVLRVHKQSAPVRLLVDGRELAVNLHTDDSVLIRRASKSARLALPAGWSYTRILKTRIGWSSRS